MTDTPTDRHLSCDVLVIGAGPAGAAAAIVLAQRGFDVLLVDRHEFPRDKVCGDALIPDALAALDRLGIKGRVLERALRLDRLRVYAPNETAVDLRGEFACVPRAVLDETLVCAAAERGARLLTSTRLTGAALENGVVVGARFSEQRSDARLTVRARFTVLATGAGARPLQLFDVCERERASAMAARVYYDVPPELATAYDHLCISYANDICPGYGWIFPGPAGIFNVGVGFFYDGRSLAPVANIRALLERFLERFPPARQLTINARLLTPIRGAPLRTGLSGARPSRPGLFVVGEAVGTTYSLSGEGIGKAMDSAMLAAELIAEAGDSSRDPAALAEEYRVRLAGQFGDRFRAYRAAQRWLASPRCANFFAWRANRGRYVRRQLEHMLNETGTPAALFSVPGLVRALLA